MRRLLAALLAAVGPALPAQEQFDTRGLPVDAAIVLVTAPTTGLQISDGSPAMKALRERLDKLAAQAVADGNVGPDMEKALRTELGIDTNDSQNAIAIGLKMAGPENITGVGILRVKVDPARIEAYARKRGISALTAGGRTGWNALTFIDALAQPKAGKVPEEPGPPSLGVFILDNRTIAICDPKDAATCFASLAGKAPSFTLNAAQKAQVARTGQGYLFATVDFSRLPNEIADAVGQKVDVVNLAAGEKGPLQCAELVGHFATAAQAKLSAQQLQGLLAAAPRLLAIDPAEPLEQQVMMKIVAEFVAAIQPVKVEGKQASFALSIETAKAIAVADQAIDMIERQAAAQATPTPAVKASGGKKKPVGATTK
jgi:hypothetical protein